MKIVFWKFNYGVGGPSGIFVGFGKDAVIGQCMRVSAGGSGSGGALWALGPSGGAF